MAKADRVPAQEKRNRTLHPVKLDRTIATTPAAASAPTKAEYDALKTVVDNLRQALTDSGLTK